MGEPVSVLLDKIANGEAHAAHDLLPIVYAELRQLAAREMAREAPGRTLQATALVHEAYLRLVGKSSSPEGRWESRAHFFGAAGRAMRQLLVESARTRNAAKRGGGSRRQALELVEPSIGAPPVELIDLDAALDRFARVHPMAARLVELRFFVGLNQSEAATMLGISIRTADRHWDYARAWLYQALAEDDDPRA